MVHPVSAKKPVSRENGAGPLNSVRVHFCQIIVIWQTLIQSDSNRCFQVQSKTIQITLNAKASTKMPSWFSIIANRFISLVKMVTGFSQNVNPKMTLSILSVQVNCHTVRPLGKSGSSIWQIEENNKSIQVLKKSALYQLMIIVTRNVVVTFGANFYTGIHQLRRLTHKFAQIVISST